MDSEDTSESSDSDKVTSLSTSSLTAESCETALSHAQMKGYVMRRGLNCKWTRYWCVLREACLYFYTRPEDLAAFDVTELLGYDVTEIIESDPEKSFILYFEHKDYLSVSLSMDTYSELCSWFQAIKAVLTSLKRGKSDGHFLVNGSSSTEEKQKSMTESARRAKEKLLNEVLKQRIEMEKLCLLRSSTKTVDAGQMSLGHELPTPVTPPGDADDKSKVCNLTRLIQRRMSTQIRLNYVQKEIEESESSPKDRRNVFLLGRKKPDLVPAEIYGNKSELVEQVKSLTTMLDVLDNCIHAQNTSPRGDPEERLALLKKGSFYSSDLTLQKPYLSKIDSKQDNTFGSSGDVSPKLSDRELSRGLSKKTGFQKFAQMKIFHRSRSRKSTSPVEEKDEPMSSSQPPSPVNNLSEVTPDVIDMTTNGSGGAGQPCPKSVSFNSSTYPEPPDNFKTDYQYTTQTLPSQAKKRFFHFKKSTKNHPMTSSMSHLDGCGSQRMTSSTSVPALHLAVDSGRATDDSLRSMMTFLKSDSPVESTGSSSPSGSPTQLVKNNVIGTQASKNHADIYAKVFAQIHEFENLYSQFSKKDNTVTSHAFVGKT